MYSNKDLSDIIKEHVSKLNLKWFEKKAVEFKCHKHYDQNHDVISIVDIQSYPNYGANEEVIDYEVFEEIHQFDFKKYCSCYLPLGEITGWGSYPHVYVQGIKLLIERSGNIDELAYELIKEISEFLKGETDVSILHKFIAKQLNSIEQEVHVQKQVVNDENYNNIIDDFYKFCVSKIYKKYEREITRFTETNDFLDFLEFNLSQSELLGLLYLLENSNFFKFRGTPILKFYLNHFLHKNAKGDYIKPKDLVTLQKQFSKIEASQSLKSKQDIISNGLINVIQKLEAVIKKLQ